MEKSSYQGGSGTDLYRNVEYRLHESLVRLQEMITILGYEHRLTECIDECKDLIKNKKYNVAVMGEFKRGKSSLINALLGSRILPADATPTTATVNRITYGLKPEVVITWQDGSKNKIKIEELTEYVTKLTDAGTSRAQRIREATICYPTVICQNHVDIIDTPGLNDDDRMTQITIDMISNVDAVVVPIHARAPFSQTEKRFVCKLVETEGIDHILFVVTFLDQLDEDDYDYGRFMDYIKKRIQTEVLTELVNRGDEEHIMEKAHRLLDNLKISGISSSLALESFVSNNRAMREKSRFEEFSNNLFREVTADQMENAVKKTVGKIRDIIGQFDAQDKLRRRRLEEELVKFNECEETVQRYCGRAKARIDAAFGADYEELQILINGINADKNILAGHFIEGLASVKENSYEKISNVMNAAAVKAAKTESERNRERKKRISRIFRRAGEKLRDEEQEALKGSVEAAGLQELSGLQDVLGSMQGFVRKILENAQFSWKVPWSQGTKDMAQGDVIEPVIRAIDISVQSYIDELNAIVNTIRINWFSQYREHIGRISERTGESIARRREEHDIKYKAYVRNYQMLSGDLDRLLSQNEELWRGFEEERRRSNEKVS